MDTDATTITYRFTIDGGTTETVSLTMRQADFTIEPSEQPLPHWTALAFHPCKDCPLPPDEGAICPFAGVLSGFIGRFDRYDSFQMADVEVISPLRTVTSRRSLQQGMASLVGLAGAVSGCPRLAFFRPMARFHLPFASEEETLFRIFSTFLLGRYLEAGGNGMIGLDVAGLREHSAAAEKVNHGMADRIRAAFTKDAVVNAIVILDIFAQAVPYVMNDALAELRYLYGLDRPQGS
ncbi:hypothetical protein H261_10244 [Paramagnetospirillum caucaseum]|uniref:Uncharacterized protein n=1 Tax=Paramagnetospirillum caucaseum TaxID=1244869 RepID=M3AC35_9PROT|nr:hypothetical protein [Paramagnetospirillum caucaseum]EME70054.1 hypothetical protein H261_10244 [Paramagnetospirillum caucaseum]